MIVEFCNKVSKESAGCVIFCERVLRIKIEVELLPNKCFVAEQKIVNTVLDAVPREECFISVNPLDFKKESINDLLRGV